MFQNSIQIFQIICLFFVQGFQKHIVLVYFFKDGLKLYVFESLKLKYKFEFEKQDWKSLKFDFKGVYFGHHALCDAITHTSRHLKFSIENTSFVPICRQRL